MGVMLRGRLFCILVLRRILIHRSLVHHLGGATDLEWLVFLRWGEDLPSMKVPTRLLWRALRDHHRVHPANLDCVQGNWAAFILNVHNVLQQVGTAVLFGFIVMNIFHALCRRWCLRWCQKLGMQQSWPFASWSIRKQIRPFPFPSI